MDFEKVASTIIVFSMLNINVTCICAENPFDLIISTIVQVPLFFALYIDNKISITWNY